MQTLDQGVRSVNRRLVSRVAGRGGVRARMAFALLTGGLTDNHQRNELRAAIRILDGGVVDPFSGKRLSVRNRWRVLAPRFVAVSTARGPACLLEG